VAGDRHAEAAGQHDAVGERLTFGTPAARASGRALRERRTALHLSQERLAHLAQVSTSTVQRRESGDHEPSEATIRKLEEGFTLATISHDLFGSARRHAKRTGVNFWDALVALAGTIARREGQLDDVDDPAGVTALVEVQRRATPVDALEEIKRRRGIPGDEPPAGPDVARDERDDAIRALMASDDLTYTDAAMRLADESSDPNPEADA
jgi:transcriptional regulator with XRE-family HTH domain